jgi:hypothetical protein
MWDDLKFNDIPNELTRYYICELNICNSTQFFDILDNPAICSNYCKVLIFIFKFVKINVFFNLIENRKKYMEPCSDIAFECDSNLVCVGSSGSKTCS